jgi:hypothetical protein
MQSVRRTRDYCYLPIQMAHDSPLLLVQNRPIEERQIGDGSLRKIRCELRAQMLIKSDIEPEWSRAIPGRQKSSHF